MDEERLSGPFVPYRHRLLLEPTELFAPEPHIPKPSHLVLPRERPFSKDLEEGLESFNRVHYLRTGRDNLRYFLHNFMRSFKETGDYKAHVLFLEGLPGAGKTYLRDNLILPYIRESIRNIPRALSGGESDIAVFHWDQTEHEVERIINRARMAFEKDGSYSKDFQALVRDFMKFEQPELTISDKEYLESFNSVAKKLLDLRVVHGEFYPKEFIRVTNAALRDKIATEVRIDDLSKPIKYQSLILVDKPGGTVLPNISAPDKFPEEQRDYGASIVQDLKKGFGLFDRTPRVLSIGYIGVIPGPRVDLLIIARHLIQQAKLKEDSLRKSLQEANKVCSVFGLAPFETYEDLRHFPSGATLPVIRDIRLMTIQMLRFISDYEGNQLELPPLVRSMIDFPEIALGNEIDEDLNNSYFQFLKAEEESAGSSGLVDDVKEVANITGNSFIAQAWQSGMQLGSARIFERIAAGFADEVAIVHNNPRWDIPDPEKLKWFLQTIPEVTK